ncbi:hypothetical protein [uncultured Cohaesibacter sp.]|uniref:hypothetical protein n=1 Tax=uncultured Cohaesibacter sp. TaxID=1002546 RepID=UPI00293107DF|nr:hypothetical protein [uncultured Cohaesibacter sp.]
MSTVSSLSNNAWIGRDSLVVCNKAAWCIVGIVGRHLRFFRLSTKQPFIQPLARGILYRPNRKIEDAGGLM